jgi:hypothetical protein
MESYVFDSSTNSYVELNRPKGGNSLPMRS